MWFDDQFENTFRRMSNRFFNTGDIFENQNEDQVHTYGPYYYGYQMTIGPDGKPQVKEWGNVRPTSASGLVSSDGAREPYVDETLNEKEKTLQLVTEMPGIDNDEIVLKGEGEVFKGGKNGDLIVRVWFESHPYFKRDGPDIFYDAKVGMVDAILGGKIKVPTLEGIEEIHVNPGSQPNSVVILKDKGLPSKKRRGNQYVRLLVDLPTKITAKQKELLEQFRDSQKP